MWRKIREFFDKSNQIDPVQWLLPRFLLNHPKTAALILSILQLGFWWFYGNYVVNHYPGNITGPRDIDELSFGFFLWGVFIPYIFWHYLSLKETWLNLYKSLCSEGVIECKSFSKALGEKISSSYFLPSLLICLGVMLFYYFYGIPAEINTGRVSFWFVTTFGEIMLILYTAFAAYIFINFILRSLILILRLKNYFDHVGIKTIHVYHIDRCGGFAPIGNLAMRLASIAVAAGVWAAGYSLLPLAAYGTINFSFLVICLYFAYLFLVPFILISLTMPVSQAMKRYKQEVVMKVSRKLQDELTILVIDDAGGEKIDVVLSTLKKMEEYQKLNALYDRVSEMPESPIKAINLKRFTGFASIPAVIGIISFFADFFQVLSWFEK